jgi:hypothetical protein
MIYCIAHFSATDLAQKLPQNDEEGHEIPSVGSVEPFSITAAHVFGSGAHRGRNDFAGCVHEELGEPFEDLLDDLRVWLLQVRDGEGDAYVRNTACNFTVGLY